MPQEQRYTDFDKDTDEREILHTWWSSLEHNKGDRASLRRVDSLAEVAFIPAYQRLYQDVREVVPVDRERLAVVAALSAHVRQHDGSQPIAQRIASPHPGSDSPPLSELRFRRLLRVNDLDILRTQLTRVIRLLDHRVNLHDLANSVYWWNERTRKRWAFTYYDHAPRDEK